MDAVAVMTDGDIFDLRPGKNGIFYDLQGNNWDAVITKVVDNPVSISQAFWAPYRKAWEFCVGIINKSAADKDAKINADLQAKVKDAKARTGCCQEGPAGVFVCPGMRDRSAILLTVNLLRPWRRQARPSPKLSQVSREHRFVTRS